MLLPTEKAEIGHLIKLNGRNNLSIIAHKEHKNNINRLISIGVCRWTPQHLHFTSKREIKEGDWCIYTHKSGHKIIFKYSLFEDAFEDQSFRTYKIEATTDSSLNLPLISQSFVEKYVQKQGDIDEIEIDMDYVPGFRIEADPMVHGEKVKTRPDGTVIVHKVKDSWTRDEVEELCHKAFSSGMGALSKSNPGEVWLNWIKINL